jgi:hypothetical protein
MSRNELMIQLWGMGIFNPTMANQSMMLLSMMDFDGKEKLMEKLGAYGGMMQQMMAMAQMIDAANPGAGVGEALAMQYGMPPPTASKTEAPPSGESSVTKKARERTANATAPR